MHRPTLVDRALFVVAVHHARRVFARFMEATRDATRRQEQVLLAKIRRNADSAFGQDYRFDQIGSYADFVRRVPILRYEDHAPYIERVKAGEMSAMFGGRQRVLMFALTSGTTAEPKYIPVTRAFLNEYRAGWNAFGIKALLDHPQAFLRPIAQVTSRMDESRTAAGIPCGAITGLMAATQKLLVRKYYVTPPCLARIEDPAAKYYTIMRLSVPADVAFLITASPATQLKLARTADAHREQIIRDVHDGTLWPDLPVSADVRAILARRMRPDPARSRELERMVSDHGRLLPRHYWNLGFLANWTGGTMGLHLREFPEYFGDVPVRDIGLLASEGRMTIPVHDATPAGILEVTSQFYEFVPRDAMEEPSPRVLRSHELEVGQEYFILLTTSSGLYRYDIGDLVRVVGYENQAPVLEFLSKGAHTASMSGEKLTEHQVILAMTAVARQTGRGVSTFVLAPQWAQTPFYTLHLEQEDWAPDDSADRLTGRLDEELRGLNIEYAAKRSSGRLGPIRPNLLPPGFLAAWDRQQAERARKGNEQYKHRYLFSRPGEDDAFPAASPGPRAGPESETSGSAAGGTAR